MAFYYLALEKNFTFFMGSPKSPFSFGKFDFYAFIYFAIRVSPLYHLFI